MDTYLDERREWEKKKRAEAGRPEISITQKDYDVESWQMKHPMPKRDAPRNKLPGMNLSVDHWFTIARERSWLSCICIYSYTGLLPA